MSTKSLHFDNVEGRQLLLQLSVVEDQPLQSVLEFFDVSAQQYHTGIRCTVADLLAQDFAKDSAAYLLHQQNLPMWGIVEATLIDIIAWLATCLNLAQNADAPSDFSQKLHHLVQSISALETDLTALTPQLSSKKQKQLTLRLLAAKKHLLKAELLFSF